MAFVIDASVAAKWLPPGADEPLQIEADALLARIASRQGLALVPDIFWPEVTQFLAKSIWRKRMDMDAAETALQALSELGLETVSNHALTVHALRLAAEFHHSAYDCTYVALAHQQVADLITADEALVRKLGSRFPIRWLGAL